MKNISLLGSTGSIGTQTLDVIRRNKDINVVAMAAGTRIHELEKQVREFKPQLVCVSTQELAQELKVMLSDMDIKVVYGQEGLVEVATIKEADIVLTAVVGMMGIIPTIEAIKAHKDIALANKETLVTAGHIIMKLAKECGVNIYPVDSEHSAIFQSLNGEYHKEVSKILLTASGGPFRGKKRSDLENVTLEDALKHPNWSMGRKITVDSATLMNKGLELMEACHLFHVKPSDVEIVVHRQSVVHSAIVLADNAVIAQLGVPDMKIPIQLALTYPERMPSASGKLSLTDYGRLTFEKPDMEAFPCLAAAVRAAETGGTAGSIVNGANERAVELFLDKKIGFNDIGRGVCAALDEIPVKCADSVDTVLEADKAARAFIDSRYHIC